MVEFFLRLSQDDVKELIADCIKSDLDKGGWSVGNHTADEVLIYVEEDRKDLNGERWAWVRGVSHARSIPNFFASYRVNDFYMSFEEHLSHEYNNVLRAFMTRKFGEEYIEALYARRVSEATLESKQLTEYLATVRETQDPSRQ